MDIELRCDCRSQPPGLLSSLEPDAVGARKEVVQLSRPMLFRCQLCGADIAVYDDTSAVTCGSCQAESTVERRQGTIALRILAKPTKTTRREKKVTSGLSIGQLTKQLVGLRQESSTVRTWKIALA